MKINMRTVNALRRRNQSELARIMQVSRQAVHEWLKYKRVPNDKVSKLKELTGLKIR